MLHRGPTPDQARAPSPCRSIYPPRHDDHRSLGIPNPTTINPQPLNPWQKLMPLRSPSPYPGLSEPTDHPATPHGPSTPSSAQPRWAVGFISTSALVLLLTGLSKLAGLWQARLGPLADPPDPVFPFLSASALAAVAALIELFCAALLWLGRHRLWATGVLAWWVATLLLYRLGLFFTGGYWTGKCSCLGPVAHWIGGTPAVFQSLPWILIALWTIGLVLLLQHQGRRLVRSLGWGVCLVCAPAWAAPAGQPQHLVLHGELVTTTLFENGKVRGEGWSTFIVWLGRDRWWVQNGFEHAFGIGGNTFHALLHPETREAAAGAHSGFYPPISTIAVTYPWLAYCSGFFFRHHSHWEHLPNPRYLALCDPQSHMAKAEVVLLDPVHLIPARITWVTTYERLKNAGRSPFLRPPTASELIEYYTDYTTLYPTGMLVCEYTVETSTNLGDLHLPTRAEVRVYAQRGRFRNLSGTPDTNPPPQRVRQYAQLRDTFLITRSTILLTNAQIVSTDVPLRELLPDRGSVVDHRLQAPRWRVHHVQYQVNSRDEWKLTPDADLTNRLHIAVREQRTLILLTYAGRGVFYLAFGLLAAAPLWLFWRAIRRPPPQP